MTLGELVYQCAQRYSDKICLTDAVTAQSVSYRDFDTLINRFAHGLIARFGAEKRYMGMMLENSINYVALSYALKKIDWIEVSINRAFRGPSLARMINLTNCDTIITSPAHFSALLEIEEDLEHLRTLIVSDTSAVSSTLLPEYDIIELSELLSNDTSHIQSTSSDTDLATVMFTSGTTGVSKGCMLSHRYAIHTAENMIGPFRLTADDVNYTPYPLSHIGPAYYDILPSLITGGRAVIRDGFSLSSFWPEVAEHGVTWFMCLGSVQQLLFSAPVTPHDKKHSVTRCWATPAPVPKELFDERFGLHLIPGGGYGSTDAGWVVVPQWDHPGGIVLPHFDITIVDENNDAVPIGCDGELLVRSKEAGLMSDGYFGMPEKTRELWKGGWFRTGDIGRVDEQGRFYFRYRIAERIRVRGEMVSGFEVEEGILGHPAVEDAAAIGIPSDLGEEDILLFVTLKPGESVTTDVLLSYCANRMAKFMVPSVITILDEMPRTSTGKPEKGKLRDLAMSSEVKHRRLN